MRKQKKKKTQEEAEAFTTAMKAILKQPEKNAQRDPCEKGWAGYYCAKEGHLKQKCPQASKPPTAPCPVCKDQTGRETAPRGVGVWGQNSQAIRTECAQASPHKLPS